MSDSSTETLDQFIERNGITAEVEWADDNPNMADATPGSSHYRVTLKVGERSMVVPFTMGPALTEEPDTETVLDCLASDSALLDEFEDGIKMTIGLGGEIESAEDVDRANDQFATIQEQRGELDKLLGHSEVDALVYRTERL